MHRTPVLRLVLLAGAVAVLSAFLLFGLDARGWVLTPPPLLASLVMLGIAALVGVMGWTVRQFVRGKRPGFDPLIAARTVALAKASAYTGALLTGWYAGHVLEVIGRLSHPPMRDLALAAGASAAAGLVMAVVGLVAERWCEVPPEDFGPDGGGASAGSAA